MTFFVCTDATGHPVVTREPSEIGDIVQVFDTRGPADELVAEIRAGRAANDPDAHGALDLRQELSLAEHPFFTEAELAATTKGEA